jgi:hypothetical protein
LAIVHLVRWVVWQLGELDRPAVCPPARITVISGTGSRSAS